jgi:hypothetical protein
MLGTHVARIGKAHIRPATAMIMIRYGKEPEKISFRVTVESGTLPLTV